MPNYYAHHVFGRRVLETLPPAFRAVLEDERDAFELGLLGPDPLFFYRPLTRNRAWREGQTIHHSPLDPVLGRFTAAAEEDLPGIRGYAAGFLCHLALDCVCHSYIDRRIARGDITHLGMEAEFDRMLMLRDGLEPLRKSYLQPLPGKAVFRAGARAFTSAGPRELERGYRSMRRATALMVRFYGTRPGRWGERACRRIPALNGASGAILSVEEKEQYTESNQELERLLEGAVPAAAEQVGRFFNTVDGKNSGAC